MGLRGGDCVALLLSPKSTPSGLAEACHRLGLEVVHLSPTLTPGAILAVLDQSDAALLLTDSEHLGRIESVRADIAIPDELILLTDGAPEDPCARWSALVAPYR